MPNDYNIILADLQDRFMVFEDRLFDDEIQLTLTKVSSYGVCPGCGHSTDRVHQTTPRSIADTPIRGRKVTLVICKRRFRCIYCGKVFTESFEDIASRGRRTRRYEKALYERAESTSLKAASRAMAVPYSTFRRVWQRMANEKIACREPVYPRILGADEFSAGKGHKNFNTVLADLAGRRVVDVIQGHDAASLEAWLEDVPVDRRPEVVVIDMWRPYRKAIRKVCPYSDIVADRFHVIRLMNEAVDNVRKAEQKRMPKGERKPLFRPRFLLLKARERLDEKERTRLRSVLRDYPSIAKAYGLKEAFRSIYARYTSKRDYDKACAAMSKWCDAALASGMVIFEKKAETVLRWFDEVTNYFKHFVTNGYTEGINNKIKTDRRVAYGYRNFDNQRTRILAGCV